MTKRDKGRLAPFVPLLITTLNSPAWKAMSHGAKSLYVALKRRVPRERNRAYISYRDAQKEIHAHPRRICEWFRELEHYGFIVMVTPGCLGVEGKGKSPHWRLTELGATVQDDSKGTPRTSVSRLPNWDGTKFKKQKPATPVGSAPLPPLEAVPLPTVEAPKARTATPVGSIEDGESTPVGSITSLTTPRKNCAPPHPLPGPRRHGNANAASLRRPTSVIGGKADMARTCQYVR